MGMKALIHRTKGHDSLLMHTWWGTRHMDDAPSIMSVKNVRLEGPVSIVIMVIEKRLVTSDLSEPLRSERRRLVRLIPKKLGNFVEKKTSDPSHLKTRRNDRCWFVVGFSAGCPAPADGIQVVERNSLSRSQWGENPTQHGTYREHSPSLEWVSSSESSMDRGGSQYIRLVLLAQSFHRWFIE